MDCAEVDGAMPPCDCDFDRRSVFAWGGDLDKSN
jgi:hypothetical protein